MHQFVSISGLETSISESCRTSDVAGARVRTFQRFKQVQYKALAILPCYSTTLILGET